MILQVFFYIFFISIPFSYRVLLYQFTRGFDEYNAVFLYASDLFMLSFLGVFLFSRLKYFQFSIFNLQLIFKSQFFKKTSIFYLLLSIFLFFAALSISFAPIKFLALYNFIRLLLLVLMAIAVARLLRTSNLAAEGEPRQRRELQTALGVIAGSAVLQSLIGFFQFFFQKSLGLWWLGEPVLGLFVPGSAKIMAEGAPILRAYGTFPHPNVLGAFLVLGLISLYYFWLRRPSEWKIWSGIPTLKSDLLLGLSTFAVLVGIVLTFSRTAWLIAIIFSLLVISYSLFVDRKHWIQSLRLLILLLSILYFLLSTFSTFIFPRAQVSRTEPAVSYRLSYDAIGLNLIKENPLGVGIGNQVIYAVKNNLYKDAGLTKVWEWQPVHNIYLLMGAEIGVLGLSTFSGFIITLLIYNLQCSIFNKFSIKQFSNVWNLSKWKLNENCKLSIENFIPKTMLLSLLMFGMTDHFLWTLEPGRLMLWVTIGFLLSFFNKGLIEQDSNYKSNL